MMISRGKHSSPGVGKGKQTQPEEDHNNNNSTDVVYYRTFVRYARELEEFILKYKTPPPDIKFWPYGPYWPPDHFGHLLETPRHIRDIASRDEALTNRRSETSLPTHSTQPTQYTSKWRGVQILFDSEKTCKDAIPSPVSEGMCPSLMFESRFESGNLRQARRVGQFEYELVLQTDLYTARHTQWYYFRVQHALPGITYKFKIVNLLKKDSLYNHGMKPLMYSEKEACVKKVGWLRSGHHVTYTRNTSCLQCPLLQRDRTYYMLEWQMEFPHAEDTYYLAHCYPYTFTDLKDDLDTLLTDPTRSKVMKREVMCETRAGNSCFLVTVTNFNKEESHSKKKAVVVSARVHPGETNSSWMMKGFLHYVTGCTRTAKELRNKFVFKIVPMLNPDGVIVGNYRCSLAARDLNRNYRHPRKDTFPTIWNTKAMMEELAREHDILVYCDLHGHSRKHNVFMYGCGSSQPGSTQDVLGGSQTEVFLQERLFPWLMSQKSPEKFWFNGCKFHVRKGKESTGRVVMFRQMKVFNSFTMEATFCGTTICRGERRHFNTLDFEHMGQVFSEVVMEYHQVQQNPDRQSEVILELTRAIAQKVLQSRGALPRDFPDFSTEAGKEALKEYSRDGSIHTSQQVTDAFMRLLQMERSRSGLDLQAGQKNGTTADVSAHSLDTLMDTTSGQTIDGCVRILDQLHVAEAEEVDSASSDSDSESEPEMKLKDTKLRRKKKKQRKGKSESQRDSNKERKKDGTSSDRPVSASALPSIHIADSDKRKSKQQNGSMGKYVKTFRKTYPTFVNKYMGRSNGGIPCFSEERLIERAAKRVAEMKKRMHEEQQKREETIAFNAGVTEEEYQKAYTAALQTVDSDLSLGQLYTQSAQKSPVHIRTGYMHGEHSPPHDATSPYSHPRDTSSDSEPEELEELPTKGVPLTALKNPYLTMGTTVPHQTLHMDSAGFQSAPLGQNNTHRNPHMSMHTIQRSRLPPMRSKPSLASADVTTSVPVRHTAGSVSALTRSGHGVTVQPASERMWRNRLHSKQKSHDQFGASTSQPHFLSQQYADLLMLRLASHH